MEIKATIHYEWMDVDAVTFDNGDPGDDIVLHMYNTLGVEVRGIYRYYDHGTKLGVTYDARFAMCREAKQNFDSFYEEILTSEHDLSVLDYEEIRAGIIYLWK